MAVARRGVLFSGAYNEPMILRLPYGARVHHRRPARAALPGAAAGGAAPRAAGGGAGRGGARPARRRARRSPSSPAASGASPCWSRTRRARPRYRWCCRSCWGAWPGPGSGRRPSPYWWRAARTRRPAQQELAALLGPLPAGVRVLQHDARDESALVRVGALASGEPVRLHRAAVEADLLRGGLDRPAPLLRRLRGRPEDGVPRRGRLRARSRPTTARCSTSRAIRRGDTRAASPAWSRGTRWRRRSWPRRACALRTSRCFWWPAPTARRRGRPAGRSRRCSRRRARRCASGSRSRPGRSAAWS